MQYRFLYIVLLIGFSTQVLSQTSYQSFPLSLEIPIAELENMVNSQVKDLVYEDNQYNNNDNDQFKTKVWKTDNAKVMAWDNETILIDIPLKVWAEKGIGAFGIMTYQDTTFELRLQLLSKLSVSDDWQFHTSTQIKDFIWIKKPVLDFGITKVSITSTVEDALRDNSKLICASIDKSIAESFELKSYVENIWKSLNQPVEASTTYKTWFALRPSKVFFEPIKVYKDKIKSIIELEMDPVAKVGEMPKNEYMPPLPFGKKKQSIQPNYNLSVPVIITYGYAKELADSIFQSQTYDVKGKKITIDSLTLYQEKDKLAIESYISGDINGSMTIVGTPIYTDSLKSITLSDTRFSLSTKNIFHKGASILFKNKIIKQIEDDFVIPTKYIEDMVLKQLQNNLNQEYMKGVHFEGNVSSILPEKIEAIEDGIQVHVRGKGKFIVRIEGYFD